MNLEVINVVIEGMKELQNCEVVTEINNVVKVALHDVIAVKTCSEIETLRWWRPTQGLLLYVHSAAALFWATMKWESLQQSVIVARNNEVLLRRRRATPYQRAHFLPFRNANSLKTGSANPLITNFLRCLPLSPVKHVEIQLLNYKKTILHLQCFYTVGVKKSPHSLLPRNAHLVLAVSSNLACFLFLPAHMLILPKNGSEFLLFWNRRRRMARENIFSSVFSGRVRGSDPRRLVLVSVRLLSAGRLASFRRFAAPAVLKQLNRRAEGV